MKQGWEYKKLLDECSILYGYPFDSKCFSTSVEDMPLIRIRDVKDGKTSTYFKGAYPKEYIIHKGDFLIGMDGEFNISPWQSEDALLNQRVCKISTNSPSLIVRYVYRFLIKELKKIEDETPFVTVKHLSAKRLKQIDIPIPPLSEQQRIVEELDLLSSIIEKKKEQLQELDNLAQSIFYDMFGDPVTNEKGWEVKKIGEIGTVERGAGISKKDFVEKGLPCIHYGQLHTIFGATTHEHKTCIPHDLLPKYKIAHFGDVVMAITSEDVEGSCKSTAWLGNYDIVVGSDAAIFHHNINGVYISYYTQTKAFFNEKAKYANGFKVTHISTKEIEKIPIPLPPLSLQQQFASKIEAIEQQKGLIKQSIKEVETLFNSKMDYYFN